MIKTFEEYNTSNKYPYKWYEDKWFILPHINSAYNWCDELGSICLIEKVETNKSKYPKNNPYKVYGESVTLFKTGKLGSRGSLAYTFSVKEWNETDFMTSDEFFKKHKDVCIELLDSSALALVNRKHVEWYLKQAQKFVDLLGPVVKKFPEEYKKYLAGIEAEKYNL